MQRPDWVGEDGFVGIGHVNWVVYDERETARSRRTRRQRQWSERLQQSRLFGAVKSARGGKAERLAKSIRSWDGVRFKFRFVDRRRGR